MLEQVCLCLIYAYAGVWAVCMTVLMWPQQGLWWFTQKKKAQMQAHKNKHTVCSFYQMIWLENHNNTVATEKYIFFLIKFLNQNFIHSFYFIFLVQLIIMNNLTWKCSSSLVCNMIWLSISKGAVHKAGAEFHCLSLTSMTIIL